MQITSPRVLAQLKVIVLALVIAVGGSYALGYSAWVGPTTSPTGNNADTPLNVGNNTQTKQGRLRLNLGLTDAYGLDVYNKSRFFGTVEVGTTSSPAKIKIVDGTQANGSVLVSDATGLASWKATSTLGLGGVAAPVSTTEYFFGGFYSGSTKNFTNPLASNTRDCPAGYSAHRVFGSTFAWSSTYATDNYIYLCIGSSDKVGQTPVGYFGGMYAKTSNSSAESNYFSSYTNPITGAKSCPAGFTAKQIGSETNYTLASPTEIWYCYSAASSVAQAEPFGGVWSGSLSLQDETGAYDDPTYINPVTGTYGCPSGYTQKQVAGLSLTNLLSMDQPLYFCYGGAKQYPNQ